MNFLDVSSEISQIYHLRLRKVDFRSTSWGAKVVLGLPGSGCSTLANVLGEAPNTEAVDCNELLDKAAADGS